MLLDIKSDEGEAVILTIQQPLISVIVPAYNVQDTIEITIDQLLNQTYKNIEIIIINDGSKDNTELLVKGISDPRVRVFNKTNGGVSSCLLYTSPSPRDRG